MQAFPFFGFVCARQKTDTQILLINDSHVEKLPKGNKI